MPLSNQIKMHMQHARDPSRSSSNQRKKFSPTKMSSLSRSPPRSRSKSGQKQTSAARNELMMYFGLKTISPDRSLVQSSMDRTASPMKRSLYANSARTLQELEEFENRPLNDETSRLIAEELACSPVRLNAQSHAHSHG